MRAHPCAATFGDFGMSEGGAAADASMAAPPAPDQPAVGLLQLPPELLHVVLEYCSALELVRCRQTCTALRTAASERTLWRALAAKDYGLDDAGTATTPWFHVYQSLVNAERAYFKIKRRNGDDMVPIPLQYAWDSDERQLYNHTFPPTNALQLGDMHPAWCTSDGHHENITLVADLPPMANHCLIMEVKIVNPGVGYSNPVRDAVVLAGPLRQTYPPVSPVTPVSPLAEAAASYDSGGVDAETKATVNALMQASEHRPPTMAQIDVEHRDVAWLKQYDSLDGSRISRVDYRAPRRPGSLLRPIAGVQTVTPWPTCRDEVMRSACAPQVAGSVVFKLLRSWNVGEEEAPNIDVGRLYVYGAPLPGLAELLLL